ncbi:MAG: VWA-like domain-containing protein [Lachnospiraceae bacterium]|nr:VWA-like domain-containing protein [Lachnospiraceae bacterium]MDY4971300.1 VWA-like domain-containing protein [Lachnospiraceae bacterium]
MYYAGSLAVQGDVLLEVLDKTCGKLRLPAVIHRIGDDAVNGIAAISLETFDVNQVESWKPLLQAQRSELKVYSPQDDERIWLPLSRTGGFEQALSPRNGNRIDFEQYDSRFDRIQDRELKLSMAVSRLLYPVRLSEDARIRYEKLVKNRFRPAMLSVVSGRWNWYGRIPGKAAELLSLKPVDRFLKKELLKKSASCGQPEFTALLSGMEPELKGGSPEPGQKADAGLSLWRLAEQELCRRKPAMEAFCGLLSFMPVKAIPFPPSEQKNCCRMPAAGTDGRNIYYTEEVFFRETAGGRKGTEAGEIQIPSGPEALARLYTHMLVHCMYLHPFSDRGDDPVFALACDVAAEYVTDQIFGPDGQWMMERQQVYDYLLMADRIFSKASARGAGSALTADCIYSKICCLDAHKQKQLAEWFVRDSHVFWSGMNTKGQVPGTAEGSFLKVGSESERRQTAADRWSSAGEGFLQAGEKKAGKQSPGAGHEQEKAELEKREGHDYRDFLRQFMILREDRILDLDSYDPVYYTYGLNAYGNIPLVEPLETKEVMRLQELVIVIDTSGSCSGRLVRFFLEETWSVFGQSGNFFDQFHVRILQCDSVVQEDVKLTNLQEAEHYMKNLVIKGGGGTDFRAAFTWIRELQRKGELRHLKGVLYFTDGFGTFPAQEPGCRTAFIFLKSRFGQVEVPFWAEKLLLELPEGADWEPEYTGGFQGNILR